MSDEIDLAKLAEVKPIVTELRALADADPDRVALRCGGATVTRRQLDRASNRRARAFAELGVSQGDFVTIGLPNSIEFIESVIATWKLGATPQPVSYRLPAKERQEIVDLAGSKLVVGAASDHRIATLPPEFQPDPTIDDGPLPLVLADHTKAMTSGGSTGRPKLILDGTPTVFAAEAAKIFKQRPDDRQLVPGPLYHNGPFLMALIGVILGQEVTIMERFDAHEALRLIDHEQITFINTVPTMLSRMHKVLQDDPDGFDLGSIRVLFHMAAPCPPWLKEAWIERLGGEKVWELYGGTEGQASTMLDGNEWLEHRGSVGRPILGGEMIVLDDNGRELPPGEVGEIYMRPAGGAEPSYEYVGAERRTHDGWESLGDIGSIDSDGYVFLSDRRTDLILAGGANVYPAEVEGAIESHPLVGSCAVVGLPDEDLGQRVHAVVQATGAVTADDLIAHVSEQLVRYKVPRSIEFVDEPLRDDAGKVRRSAVRVAAIARMTS